MNIIAERIIEVLKADNTLTDLLTDENSIFAANLQERDTRKKKYILVSLSVGEDGNAIPVQQGVVNIEGAVNRTEVDSFTDLTTIMDRVDTVLNKGEQTLTDSDWRIINFVRTGSPTEGIQVDDETNEYFMDLEYTFIIDESN